MMQLRKPSGQVAEVQRGEEKEPEECGAEAGGQRTGKSKAAWARERHRANTAPKELDGWGSLKTRPCKVRDEVVEGWKTDAKAEGNNINPRAWISKQFLEALACVVNQDLESLESWI